jgi:hypothetical protein
MGLRRTESRGTWVTTTVMISTSPYFACTSYRSIYLGGGECCYDGCPCELTDWRNHTIHLTELEEVDTDGFKGYEHAFEFLELVFRYKFKVHPSLNAFLNATWIHFPDVIPVLFTCELCFVMWYGRPRRCLLNQQNMNFNQQNMNFMSTKSILYHYILMQKSFPMI